MGEAGDKIDKGGMTIWDEFDVARGWNTWGKVGGWVCNIGGETRGRVWKGWGLAGGEVWKCWDILIFFPSFRTPQLLEFCIGDRHTCPSTW